MRVQLASDVHLEWSDPGFDTVLKPSADTLVLAGDIGVLDDTTRHFLERCSEAFKHVIYVPGNHELYSAKRDMEAIDADFGAFCAALGNVHYAPLDTIEIDDVVFICATLWSHIPRSVQYEVATCVNDYRYVHTHGKSITPAETSALHEAHKQFAVNELRKHAGKKCVVVTHHPPHTKKTSHPRYDGSCMNAAFTSDFILEIPAAHLPAVWMCGHTHYNFDRLVNDTRLVSNQYRRDGGNDFSDKMVIEI